MTGLSEHARRLELAIEGSRDGVWDWNIETSVVFFNRAQFEMLGYRDGEVVPSLDTWRNAIHPEDAAHVMAALQAHLSGQTPTYEVNYRSQTATGGWMWVRARGKVTERDETGRPLRMVGTTSDIRALKRRERLFEAMAEATSTTVGGTAFFERLMRVLAETAEVRLALVGMLTGPSQSQVQTIALWDTSRLLPNERYAIEDSPCAVTVRSNDCCFVPDDVVARFPADALLQSVGARSYLGHPLRGADGQAIGVLALIHDKAIERTAELDSLLRTCAVRAGLELSRQRAEEALTRREAELRESQRLARVGSWWTNLTTGEVRRSTAHLALFGFGPDEHPTQQQMSERIHPQDRQGFFDTLTRFALGAGENLYEFRLVLPTGEVRTALIRGELVRGPDGRPAELRGTVQDITDERRLQQQLRHAEKLEAIGRLAGGIAHDFNNVLSVISGNLSVLSRDEVDPERLEIFDDLTTAAERAAALVRQLVAFGRPGHGVRQVVDLTAAITQAQRLLQRTLGDDLELVLENAPGPLPVLIDPSALDQVLLNLALNARDAMAELPAGRTRRLTLATRRQERDGRAWGVLEVTDTGIGLSPEVQAKLFEPFFTTKEPGKGTGLGLASVYAIARGAGGSVEVSSSVGEGSRFSFVLPLSSSPAEPVARAATSGSLSPLRVLLAEDDDLVRSTLTLMLERLGADVVSAHDGHAAFDLWRSQREDFGVLVSDVRMPRMGGFELAERLWKESPALPVVFLSGAFDATPPAPRPTMRLVRKPAGPDELREAILGVVTPR